MSTPPPNFHLTFTDHKAMAEQMHKQMEAIKQAFLKIDETSGTVQFAMGGLVHPVKKIAAADSESTLWD